MIEKMMIREFSHEIAKKYPAYKLGIRSGYMSIDLVDPITGVLQVHMLYADDSGFHSIDGTRHRLEECGYDSHFAQWDRNGAFSNFV